MFLKIYQKYIVKEFLLVVFKTSFVFLSLIIILGTFDELSFFSKIDVNFYFPVLMVLMNSLSVLYVIFPFIFLISAQFFFIKILDSNELIAFKSYGLSNNKILGIITLTSFFTGIIIISIFYNISAILKFEYLDLKNAYTKDNKYLASITENGLWIKDHINSEVHFINAEKISPNKIHNVDIHVFNKKFKFLKSIFATEVDITKNEWLMNEAIIMQQNGDRDIIKNYSLTSNFNYINIKHQKPKIFYAVGGILMSVVIYYMNFFFGALGKNEQIPVLVSIWLPISILSITSLIGVIRLNEK